MSEFLDELRADPDWWEEALTHMTLAARDKSPIACRAGMDAALTLAAVLIGNRLDVWETR